MPETPSSSLAAPCAPSNSPTTAPTPPHGWVPCGANEWRHGNTSDTWRGLLRDALPFGEGRYVFSSTGLEVQGNVRGNMEHLVFSGKGVMQWKDGSRFTGDLHESKFDGKGVFKWANGDVYNGDWRQGQRHGFGTLETWQGCLLKVNAIECGKLAHSMRYVGDWANDVMEGNGVIEYFEVPDRALRELPHATEHEGEGASRGRLLRRFDGCFKKGFATKGFLQTEQGDFQEVQFDGGTDAGDFATWYWAVRKDGCTGSTVVVDLDRKGEEFRAASSRFTASMPGQHVRIDNIQRVQNDDRRNMYELQRRALEKKVTLPPRSMIWNSRTMERWAFHAPVLHTFLLACVQASAGAPTCFAVRTYEQLTDLHAKCRGVSRRSAEQTLGARNFPRKAVACSNLPPKTLRLGKALCRRAFRRLLQAVKMARCSERASTSPGILRWRTSTLLTVRAARNQEKMSKKPCVSF